MNTPTDEKNLHITKAQKAVADAMTLLLEAVNRLESVIAAENYQRGFDDGVQHVRVEFKRITSEDDPEPTLAKPYVLTEIDRIMSDSIISYVTDSPGLRTIDITSKVVILPVKPAITEKSVRLAINRLKNTGKIEDKAGRWYLAGSKKAPAQDFKVMRYMEDGSKYLGADAIKS